MEQILYNHEMVLNLLKGDNHLRQIARDIRCNHMTVKRELDNLVKDNVLDVRKEGKNNVYSIKKTIEAQNMVYMAELYKLNKLIIRHPELKQNLKELKELPVQIIALFGSYAKGTETAKSDIDVYIDTAKRAIKDKAAKLNEKFNIKIGDYNKESLLIKEIESNHIIIKGIEAFYEKSKFFD